MKINSKFTFQIKPFHKPGLMAVFDGLPMVVIRVFYILLMMMVVFHILPPTTVVLYLANDDDCDCDVL